MLQEIQSPEHQIHPQTSGLAVDRELLRRIVLSSVFARSPRLTHFLRYICAETEAGRSAGISEQHIGAAVFGRDPDYDSAVDSIVRSHASRLRHRLREYFETEGSQESVILTIPKGSYIPRFDPRQRPQRIDAPSPLPFFIPGAAPAEKQADFTEETQPSPTQPRIILSWKMAFVLSSAVALLLAIAWIAQAWVSHHHQQHIFWSGFLNPAHGTTMLVEADSGLVMLQHFTRRPVPLASYISGEYLQNISSAEEKPEVVARLGVRRYTPAVDSAIYEKLTHLLPGNEGRLNLRYARDLRLDDLKHGNAILLGTHESNPWVELFENSMNFTFRNDLAAGTTAMENRHPLPGEQSLYPMLANDPNHTVYGLVAYRPNLTHTGDVLIIEGETMAGTQTASEFLLDDSHLLPFLQSIRRKDGAIPHFEVLVRSSSLAGESSQMEMVAHRTDAD